MQNNMQQYAKQYNAKQCKTNANKYKKQQTLASTCKQMQKHANTLQTNTMPTNANKYKQMQNNEK